jgi:Zn-dependent protease with chaperone function
MSTSPSDTIPPATSGPAAIGATYFDGRSAMAHAVTLTLVEGVLQVRGAAINRDEPITVLRVSEPMGAAPRLISWADGAHCEVRDHAGMARLLEASGFEDSLVVRLQRRWRWAFASIVVTLAFVFAGYHWGLPAASEWLAFQMPEAALSKMGSSTLEILDRAAFAPSKLPESRQQALRDAFERLLPPEQTRARYTLHFRHGGAIGANALALPDGSMVVTDQLVALAEHDEEILAVLAHELGHINRRHGLRMLIQGSIVAFVVSFYIGDVSSVAAGLPTLLLQARYSRDHEREADQYGAAMLRSNAMSPRRLADMLAKLEASHRAKKSTGDKDSSVAETQRGESSSTGGYLRSHPATQERIDALKSAAQ